MELGSIPITVAFTADHVLIHDPTELLEISLRRLFYYVILETKLQVFLNSPTLKMKPVSIGIDPDDVGSFSIFCRPRFH